MNKISIKIIIIFSVLIIKVIIWFVFQNKIIDFFNYISENLGIVPKGKQILIEGISKLILIIKVSLIGYEFFMNLIIFFFLKLFHNKFTYSRFTQYYLIVSFTLLTIAILLIK